MTGDLILETVCRIQVNYFILLIRTLFFEIANSFHIKLSIPTEIFPTRYSNNTQDSNSVLNLMFLCPNLMEHNNYHIHPE